VSDVIARMRRRVMGRFMVCRCVMAVLVVLLEFPFS